MNLYSVQLVSLNPTGPKVTCKLYDVEYESEKLLREGITCIMGQPTLWLVIEVKYIGVANAY